MPLSGSVLGSAIIAATQAPPEAQGKIMAMAEAIVQHFQQNAVVNCPAQGLTLVATGAMAGGPGVPVTGTVVGQLL